MPPPSRTYERRLAIAAAELDRARERRNILIFEATEAGLTRRQIAEVTGLTASGVQYLVNKARA